MGFLGTTFNTDELPEGRGFDLIPTGWYSADIVKADVKPTKSNDGTRLNIQFKITDSVDGKYIGRVVFAGLNISLPNSPSAENIGKQQLGDLLKAIGLASVEDSDELIGYSLRIRVRTREGNEQYPEPQNDVSGFKPLDDAQSTPSSPKTASRKPDPAPARKPAPASAPASMAPAGKKPPPWAKKK